MLLVKEFRSWFKEEGVSFYPRHEVRGRLMMLKNMGIVCEIVNVG